ncbi:hypothetical protein [Flammeovirga sp. OC4]|uniref:hypothetical protein n=1 Tax=Flammeovirga sp. OC4 TaxID=1382345 RepID=UPI0012E03006|nr:hypothetical protein [Flammeovirga sp. OC4]
MGYYLKAFIGQKESLVPIRNKYSNSKLVDLSDKISMIPITDELFDEMNQMENSSEIASFEFLTEYIENKTLDLIGNKKLAYFESEFFGGQGGHIGLIWVNGKREFIGEFKKDTLNKILKKLGVIRNGNQDEFETVGLDSHRNIEDWID